MPSVDDNKDGLGILILLGLLSFRVLIIENEVYPLVDVGNPRISPNALGDAT